MTTELSPKEEITTKYYNKRVIELLSMTKKELAEYIASLEVEFMDLSDSVLDDDYPFMAVHGVQSNLSGLEDSALSLMKDLDKENEAGEKLFPALWKYHTV